MEAHAEDEWPVGTVVPEDEDIGAVSLKQPTRIEDRYLVAKALNRDLPLGNDFRFLVDTIDNSFNNSYASWPFRCWIVDENGKIAYMSQPPPNGVAEDLSVTELTAWLEAFQQ